jgi:hypothetical protein
MFTYAKPFASVVAVGESKEAVEELFAKVTDTFGTGLQFSSVTRAVINAEEPAVFVVTFPYPASP